MDEETMGQPWAPVRSQTEQQAWASVADAQERLRAQARLSVQDALYMSPSVVIADEDEFRRVAD